MDESELWLQQEEGAEETPLDLRLEMRVKNNVLWHAIFDVYESVSVFCRAHPEVQHSQSAISDLMRFKSSPFKKNGSYREICVRIASLVGVYMEELFPAHLYEHITESEKVVEVSSFAALPGVVRKEILSLHAPSEHAPEILFDLRALEERIDSVLTTLTYREREIIKYRYGLCGYEEQTLEQLGALFHVTRSRIREIEAKAICKLRRPVRSRQLKEFVE